MGQSALGQLIRGNRHARGSVTQTGRTARPVWSHGWGAMSVFWALLEKFLIVWLILLGGGAYCWPTWCGVVWCGVAWRGVGSGFQKLPDLIHSRQVSRG